MIVHFELEQTMKKSLILAAALALAPLAFSADHHHNEAPLDKTAIASETIAATGFVRLVDSESKKLTIEHDPIPSLNWPQMTMRFTYDGEQAIKGIKTGDKVKFDFVQEGRVSLIKHIEKVK
ncbi:MAG: copper-binding protein [Helicobacteraceae bacterium]|jgi:Cu(I)/Ag(I) efflux system protein CusF|nr:copper-binding protein [Helicobacteraceae bacterium]